MIKLSDHQRQTLEYAIWDRTDISRGQAEDVIQIIAENLTAMSEEKSFSELIIEGNEAKKTCGQCGQLCVAYKEKFRKQWLTCLNALNAFGAMTYKQLADVLVSHYGYKDKAANGTARSFCLARHWLVIEKTNKSINRCPVYQITQRGREVLANRQSVAVFLWIPARGIEMDLSVLPQPTFTFATSILPDDPGELANKSLHVAEAAPALNPF